MKKYIFTLILTILVCVAYAQGTKLEEKKAKILLPDLKDNEIDKYVGTWMSKQGNTVFMLKMKKVTKNMNTKENPVLVDMLLGGYSLKVDGKEVINTINDESSIVGGAQGKKGFITIYMKDKGSAKNGEGTMTLLNPNTVKWQIGDRKGHTFFGNDRSKAFTIPTYLTLKRVE